MLPSARTGQLFDQAIEHHRVGRLPEAQALYREILAIDDRHAEALHHLGVAAHQEGAHEQAAELIGRAISIDGSVAEFHYNIASVYGALGRTDQAVWHNERALALKPGWARAHHNLGTLLAAGRRFDAAAARYRQALALDPAMEDTWYELGNALLAIGQPGEAASAFEQVLHRRPDYAQAHNNLGLALSRTGLIDQAESHYRRALSLKPDLVEASINLGSALVAQDRAHEAIPLVREALRLRDDPAARMVFVQCVRLARSYPTDAAFRRLLVRAVSEGWDRPTSFFRPILSILKHGGSTAECLKRASAAWPNRPAASELFGPDGLAALAGDELLSCLLVSAANIDLEMERFLTAARRALLVSAAAEPELAADDHALAFSSRLAAQCFINEYVFAETDEEGERIAELRDSLEAALKSGTPIAPLELAVLAAYLPLSELAGVQRLLERFWPDAVTNLLRQQVSEPAEERSCRDTVRLTDIDDKVSAKVQRQYEENPYPRWIRAGRYPTPLDVNAHLRRMLPRASFRPLPDTHTVEMLVAGCGTGRQAVETAQLIAGVRITAIDLSLDSLCYAIRKTRELGIGNIAYMQGDLCKVRSLGRTFDIVEATGVLHHLADPFAGWRALLTVLKPGGLMHLGLYSRIGRTEITAARAFVAEHDYPATAPGIRRCRQEIIERADDPMMAKISRLSDFYSISECRDLLFHVQEHCLTLPQIKRFVEEQGLDFLGLVLSPEVRARYSRMFPGDRSQTDLDKWHEFETKHPDTFTSMYHFWLQKKH